jgi:hypothetical protein
MGSQVNAVAGGAGSGGSYLIRANTMTGRGSITAHGGKAAGCTFNVIVSYVSLLFMSVRAATRSHDDDDDDDGDL